MLFSRRVPAGERHQADTLVLGTGLAGLYAALRAAERGDVIIATKGHIEQSSSFWAQGGVAAAMGEDDTVELHEADTLRVGRGLCREEAVELLTEEAPRHIARLRDLGVGFEQVEGGALELGLEAGHSRRRVAHAGGGCTGRVIVEGLVQRVLEHARITVLDDAPAWALISDGERCYGAHTARGPIEAATTVLATGGVASLYARSTNPASSRGEGLAFAYQAGAAVADMEFVQFHPTALVMPGAGDGFLISEAVRGEGAWLVNAAGERFMRRRHEQAELAPRDELARAIVDEMRATGHGCVYLTLAHLDPTMVHRRFSGIAEQLAQLGLDIARDALPVAPAAHYTMGGVATDLHGRTSLRGLLACGEVACTGVHGANRLASNSLLECLVFADRAGAVEAPFDDAPAELLDAEPPRFATQLLAPSPSPASSAGHGSAGHGRAAAAGAVAVAPDARVVQQLLWDCAGVTRNADGLALVARVADDWHGEAPAHIQVAGLIGQAALLREESRGAHFRSDHPAESPAWQKHVVLQLGADPDVVTW